MKSLKLYRKNNTGFTLVEIIVVLVILAILAAAMIPTMLGYVGEAQRTVCIEAVGIIEKHYKASAIEQLYASADPDDYAGAFDRAVYNTYGFHIGNNNEISGICPNGGVYTAVFTNEGEITVTCDKHGEVLRMSEKNIQGKIIGLLGEFLERNSGLNSIDSEATGGNFTPQVLEVLKKAGYSQEYLDKSIWYFDVKNKTFYIGSKDDIVIGSDGKKTVDVRKYLVDSETSESENCRIALRKVSSVNGGQPYEVLMPSGRH